jgi:hypothetical protein
MRNPDPTELAAIAIPVAIAEAAAIILFVVAMTVWISIGCGA